MRVPITVVTGPPGAGKTTISAALARSKQRGVHLPTDHCYHWIVTGYVPPWKPQANTQNTTVIEAIASSTARYSAGGYHVVVDGNIGPWFLERFVDATGHPPAGVDYIVLRPARQIALARATRRTGDRDLTDPEPITAMYDAFEDLGSFERHVVDTTHQDPAATLAVIIQGLDSGAFALTGTTSSD